MSQSNARRSGPGDACVGSIGILPLTETSAGIGHDGAQRRGDFWRIPFGGTNGAPNFLTSTIDNERGRQADGTHGAQGLSGRVGVNGNIANVDLGIEFADGFEATAIDRERHDLELGAAQGPLQPVERGHFLSAGHAPGGPDIEDHDLSPKSVQTSCAALLIGELDSSDRSWAVMQDQPSYWFLSCG